MAKWQGLVVPAGAQVELCQTKGEAVAAWRACMAAGYRDARGTTLRLGPGKAVWFRHRGQYWFARVPAPPAPPVLAAAPAHRCAPELRKDGVTPKRMRANGRWFRGGTHERCRWCGRLAPIGEL